MITFPIVEDAESFLLEFQILQQLLLKQTHLADHPPIDVVVLLFKVTARWSLA